MKMIKNFIVICITILFFTCTTEKQYKKFIKVGVSVATMQESVYHFMKKVVDENAKKFNAKIFWFSAGNSKEKQKSDIKQLLSHNIDVLIFHSVDTKNSYEILKPALEKKIPVVAMDRLPEDVKVKVYVTANSYKVGKIQAEYIASALKGRGNVIVIKGEKGNNVAEEITKGNIDMLSHYPFIKIIGIYPHHESAVNIARNITMDVDKIIKIKGISVFVKYTPIKLITKYNVLEMKYRWKDL